MNANNPEQSIKESTLVGLMICDVPIPLRRLHGISASRTTFHRWKNGVNGNDGKVHRLPIMEIEGQGPSVVPSELRTFLTNIGRRDEA
jgi:hypothetical protein